MRGHVANCNRPRLGRCSPAAAALRASEETGPTTNAAPPSWASCWTASPQVTVARATIAGAPPGATRTRGIRTGDLLRRHGDPRAGAEYLRSQLQGARRAGVPPATDPSCALATIGPVYVRLEALLVDTPNVIGHRLRSAPRGSGPPMECVTTAVRNALATSGSRQIAARTSTDWTSSVASRSERITGERLFGSRVDRSAILGIVKPYARPVAFGREPPRRPRWPAIAETRSPADRGAQRRTAVARVCWQCRTPPAIEHPLCACKDGSGNMARIDAPEDWQRLRTRRTGRLTAAGFSLCISATPSVEKRRRSITAWQGHGKTASFPTGPGRGSYISQRFGAAPPPRARTGCRFPASTVAGRELRLRGVVGVAVAVRLGAPNACRSFGPGADGRSAS